MATSLLNNEQTRQLSQAYRILRAIKTEMESGPEKPLPQHQVFLFDAAVGSLEMLVLSLARTQTQDK